MEFQPLNSDTALDIIDDVEEFVRIHERMIDEDVTVILGYVTRMIAKPDIGMLKAPAAVVQLEALSTKFAILATYYSSFEKGDTAKKNMYYTLKEKTKDLADAVKYLAR